MEPIKVTITRETSGDEGTFGTLEMEGFKCKTGELPWRDNKPQVSCVPPGTYSALWQDSPKHGMCYHLVGVPDRSFVEIHSANFVGDKLKGYACEMLGCITLGKDVQPLSTPDNGKQLAIISSRITMAKFHELCAERPLSLTIKDA